MHYYTFISTEDASVTTQEVSASHLHCDAYVLIDL